MPDANQGEMPQTSSRPDLRAHETAIRLDIGEATRKLADLLTPRMVAYIAGVGETRAIKEWISGIRVPREDASKRIRTALQVALFLSGHDSRQVVQAWFQGLNPQLGDTAPARHLRDGDPEQAGRDVIAAARAFVDGG